MGIFPPFRHFMRKWNVGHGCEMGRKKIWGEEGLSAGAGVGSRTGKFLFGRVCTGMAKMELGEK